MSSKYEYIQYARCKVFHGEKHAGRMAEGRNAKGEIVKCCLGATTEPTEWGDICPECLECEKYIRKVIGEI